MVKFYAQMSRGKGPPEVTPDFDTREELADYLRKMKPNSYTTYTRYMLDGDQVSIDHEGVDPDKTP